MSGPVSAGDACAHPHAPVNEFAHVRATLAALADARGVPPLQALLTRAEDDWAAAHAALDTAAHATHSLSAFQAALFNLRAVLEPLRDSLYEYEDDADALFWAHAAPNDTVQLALAALRAHRHALTDLLFALPAHPPRPAPRRPSGRRCPPPPPAP